MGVSGVAGGVWAMGGGMSFVAGAAVVTVLDIGAGFGRNSTTGANSAERCGDIKAAVWVTGGAVSAVRLVAQPHSRVVSALKAKRCRTGRFVLAFFIHLYLFFVTDVQPAGSVQRVFPVAHGTKHISRRC